MPYTSYLTEFPEVKDNAYKYFNYDRRIIDERVDRLDQKSLYKGPDNLTDSDYEDLVSYALTILDPRLMRYCARVACEDALLTAIRHFRGGMFDGKINASRYNVLLRRMLQHLAMRGELIPGIVPLRLRRRGLPGKPWGLRREPVFLNLEPIEPKEDSMLKNAGKYTERLDKIADEIEAVDPDTALRIDMISDVIEGRREASSLKWDADEDRYMANRFNYRVRQRDPDESYMDKFNESDFEQVKREFKNPQPVKGAYPYQKVTLPEPEEEE